MTPTRRRRSLSPTQFRFLYPATPLAVPGSRAAQLQNQQQTPQGVSVPDTPDQSPTTNNQSQTSTPTIQPTSGTPMMMPAPHMAQAIDPTQLSTAMLYQNKGLTPQQQALLSQLPQTQSSLIGPTQHSAVANSSSQLASLTAPMRPMDVAKEWYLDYITPQSIKFYNKAVEALPGEKFNGNMIHTWLQVLRDRAYNCAWDSILTINGKLLTQHYAEITPAEVRAHAQTYQNEGRRKAQNAEMLMQCLKASITKTVYSRLSHLESKWTITRDSDKRAIFDGVCYLKTIIDCYHVNTRSSTAEVRTKLAQLHLYMKHTAKGDVVQLCTHTRDLLAKLRAAGEDTKDLLTNLIAALRQSSNQDFLRWLNLRVDMWSTKQIDWQPDGSDLMQEAEGYYQELKAQRLWSKKGGFGQLYINEVTVQEEEDSTMAEQHDNVENKPHFSNAPDKELKVLTLQLKKLNKKIHKKSNDQKYKWKLIPPKSGDASTKLMKENGVKKTYYWCTYHNQWTRHKPSECKKLPIKSREQRRQEYQQRKTAYMEAKAALQELHFSSDEDTDSHTGLFEDTDSDSNTSDSTEYFSDVDSNTS